MGRGQQALAQRPSDWIYLTSLDTKHPYPTELYAKPLQKNVLLLCPDCTWTVMLGPSNQDRYGKTGFIQSPQQESEHLRKWDPQEGPTLRRKQQAWDILWAHRLTLIPLSQYPSSAGCEWQPEEASQEALNLLLDPSFVPFYQDSKTSQALPGQGSARDIQSEHWKMLTRPRDHRECQPGILVEIRVPHL